MDAMADATLSLLEPSPQLRRPEPATVSCAAVTSIAATAAQQSTALPPGTAQDRASAAATATATTTTTTTTQPDTEAAEAADEMDEAEDVEIVEDGEIVEAVEGDPKQSSPDAAPADAVELAMQALTAAWRNVSKQKKAAKPKPVPDTDGWQIYRVERPHSNRQCTGDNYLISPRGDKLASLAAARRWLSMFGAAAVASGAKGEAIDTHGRAIKLQPKEKRHETSRLLAMAELHVGSSGTVRLQLMAVKGSKLTADAEDSVSSEDDDMLEQAEERAEAALPPASEEALRVADNSSGYLGVTYNKTASKPYSARVRCGGEQLTLGRFATAKEAALCIARSAEKEAVKRPRGMEAQAETKAGTKAKAARAEKVVTARAERELVEEAVEAEAAKAAAIAAAVAAAVATALRQERLRFRPLVRSAAAAAAKAAKAEAAARAAEDAQEVAEQACAAAEARAEAAEVAAKTMEAAAKAVETAAKAEVAQATAAQATAEQACAAAEVRAEAAEVAAKGPASKRKLSLAPDHPFAKRPAKEARPAPQPPTPPAAPSPASYAAASPQPRANQRVRVWWDKKTYFDGRVIDTRSELGRGGKVQQRRWHTTTVSSAGMCVTWRAACAWSCWTRRSVRRQCVTNGCRSSCGESLPCHRP